MKKTIKILCIFTVMCLGLVLIPNQTFAETGDIIISSDNFPDDIFRNHVNLFFDIDGNYKLSHEEIEQIIFLNIGYMDIKDLTGIEYFTELEFLDCRGNLLENVDLSKNTKLFDLTIIDNKLTKLDVSTNTDLKTLRVERNQLESLDVSNNKKLESLRIYSNKITSLDLSNNTELWYLDGAYNQLESVNVSNSSKLECLILFSNKIKSIDVSNNINLYSLIIDNNQLSHLDLSKNNVLLDVSSYGNVLEYGTYKDYILLSDLGLDSNKVTNVKGAILEDGKFVDFTFDSNITYDYDIEFRSQLVNFAIKPILVTTHSITTTTDGNGTITPDGSVTVIEGEDISFTITPNEGYEIGKVSVDGVEVSITGDRYVITKVMDDMEINVDFNKVVIQEEQKPDITAPETGYNSNDLIFTVLGICSLLSVCILSVKKYLLNN